VVVGSLAVALVILLAGSRVTCMRDEGVAIATTAVIILGSGFGDQTPLLDDRLVEVIVGVGIGAAVNLLLIPPLRDRQASRYVDSMDRQMGELLSNMADGLTGSWATDGADGRVEGSVSLSRG